MKQKSVLTQRVVVVLLLIFLPFVVAATEGLRLPFLTTSRSKSLLLQHSNTPLPNSSLAPSTRVSLFAAASVSGIRGGARDDDGDGKKMSDDDKYEKEALAAVANMKFCYKAAFFTIAVDLGVSLLELFDKEKRLLPWTWYDAANFLDSLGVLGFAIGLVRATGIYEGLLTQRRRNSTPVTPSVLLQFFSILQRVWLQASLSLLMAAIVTATEMHQYTNNPLWLTRGPAGVGGVAVVGAFLLYQISAFAAKKAAGRIGLTVDKEFDTAQQRGFSVVHNMMICMGAFTLLGTCQLVTILAEPTSSLLEKGLALLDVLEQFLIAGLLATLARSFRRAVVQVTSRTGIGSRNSDDREVFRDLYAAQKEFYKRIGNVLLWASIFTLLGTLYTVLLAPLLG